MKPCILVVGPTPPPYHGGSVFTTWVLTKLPQEEFSLIHLDTADRRGLRGIGQLDFTNIYLALRHGSQFVWLLLSQKPAVVYLQLSQALLPFLRDCLFLVPAILFRRKIVVHLHGSVFRSVYGTWPRWARALTRFVLSRVSRAIVLCERLKLIFADFLPYDRIVAIPNGIEIGQETVEAPARITGSHIVLTLGALSRQKGTLDILRAVPSVVRRCPEARFVFAGEWHGDSTELAARRLMETENIGQYVQVLGPVVDAEKQALLQAASVFLLPSYHEGHPIAILEAMAAGLPVIASDVGCIAEIVGDGIGGSLIEPGDVQQLAAKIVQLLEDAALRKKLGRAAYERVLTNYRLATTLESLRTVFAEVLAESRVA